MGWHSWVAKRLQAETTTPGSEGPSVSPQRLLKLAWNFQTFLVTFLILFLSYQGLSRQLVPLSSLSVRHLPVLLLAFIPGGPPPLKSPGGVFPLDLPGLRVKAGGGQS